MSKQDLSLLLNYITSWQLKSSIARMTCLFFFGIAAAVCSAGHWVSCAEPKPIESVKATALQRHSSVDDINVLVVPHSIVVVIYSTAPRADVALSLAVRAQIQVAGFELSSVAISVRKMKVTWISKLNTISIRLSLQ